MLPTFQSEAVLRVALPCLVVGEWRVTMWECVASSQIAAIDLYTGSLKGLYKFISFTITLDVFSWCSCSCSGAPENAASKPEASDHLCGEEPREPCRKLRPSALPRPYVRRLPELGLDLMGQPKQYHALHVLNLQLTRLGSRDRL